VPFGTPVYPVTLTVITVDYARANLVDPILWLRLMTGNADPPGSSYVVVSDSVSGTSWKRVPTDAIADLAVTAAKLAAGAAQTNLGYRPMNPAGDSMSGPLQVQTHLIVAPTGAAPGDLQLYEAGGASFWLLTPGANVFSILRSGTGTGLVLNAGADQVVWLGNRIWTSANAPSYAGTVTAPIFAATVADGATPPLSVHVNQANIAVPNLKAARATFADAATTATSATSAANATRVGGFLPSGTPAPNVVPVADAAGKLDAWVSPAVAGAYVPTGAIVAFASLAALTAAGSGWARHTPANGRLLAGDDGGVSFTAGTQYGTNWQHTHADSGHIHGASALGVGGRVGAASSSNGVASGGGNAAAFPHDHDAGSLDVSGSTDNGAAAIGATTWLPPSLGVVWAIKL
jgi:hypothetical protein